MEETERMGRFQMNRDQGCQIPVLEGNCPGEFSDFPAQIHLVSWVFSGKRASKLGTIPACGIIVELLSTVKCKASDAPHESEHL